MGRGVTFSNTGPVCQLVYNYRTNYNLHTVVLVQAFLASPVIFMKMSTKK